MRVVIVGGGVAGLASALQLGRQGHSVTVVERDDTPLPATADEAFDWDRRGAPQVRHSHAFLARLRNTLRDQQPDVLTALLDAGAAEIRFGDDLPPTMEAVQAEPGDDDLVMLACRRSTFEWVLRGTALAEGRVTIRTGAAVTGFVSDTGDAGDAGATPIVRGVTLADGAHLGADLVVVATGRRSAVPDWVDAIGGKPIAETVEETGIVYASRFYRLLPAAGPPPSGGLIGADLGYIKYGTFVGDNRTVSITLAVPSEDHELRQRISDPDAFDAAARSLRAAAPWLDGRTEALTPDVHVMGGLLNRWCDFVTDGRPAALGVIPVGDSVLCTNPLYGRGCSTAYWSASLLADALHAHRDDVRAAAVAYDDALREQILPWYRSSVEQDREARRVAAALLAGDDPYSDASDPRAVARSILRDGLVPALRTDPVVLRTFLRNLNLLSPPDALLTDADFGARVLAVLQTKDERAPEPPLGPPDRAAFMACLADPAAATPTSVRARPSAR